MIVIIGLARDDLVHESFRANKLSPHGRNRPQPPNAKFPAAPITALETAILRKINSFENWTFRDPA
jgi:hypothetical protein